MIDRYALPQLREIFGERHKLELWLQIELLALEALAESGVVPEADYERIRREIGEVDPDRAREIERESQHDVIAFLRSITEGLGPEGRWLHYGLTSSDVLDTATAVVLRDATGVVVDELARLVEVVRRLAIQHRETAMVGRSPWHPRGADHVRLQGRRLARRAPARRGAPGAGARGRERRLDLGRRRHARERRRRCRAARAHRARALR